MMFFAVVALDVQGAKPPAYKVLHEDLPFFAQVWKIDSPANMFRGEIHAPDLATAQATLRDGLKSAFDANGLHGTARFWLSERLYEDSIVA